MAEHITEEQQVEAIKKWWKENGKAVIAGLVIGFAALFGWRYWSEHREEQAQAASDLYAQTLAQLQQGKTEEGAMRAGKVAEQYQGTVYGPLARLALAKAAVQAGDTAGARKHLESAMNNAEPEALRHVARLRLARLLIADGELDAALALLDQAEPGAFEALYRESKGDIYLARGERQRASELYRAALAGIAPDSPYRSRLEMKIDDTAVAAQTPEQPQEAGQ